MINPEAFDNIYLNNVWGYKSGPGSDPKFAKLWIKTVNYFLEKEDIKTVIDIGCGDWRLGREYNLENKNYTGIDISSVILNETKLNAKENIKFIYGDFEVIDIEPVDLIIIKDVLQHLPNTNIINIINKITKNSRYALFCDDMSENNNEDIDVVGYRHLDLSEQPFSFNFKKIAKFGDKVISLYNKEESK